MDNKGNLTTGILIGVGISFGAYYLYTKNKDKVDEFLKSQGIHMPESENTDFSSMSLEELVSTKEHIEDLIAEIEQKEQEEESDK